MFSASKWQAFIDIRQVVFELSKQYKKIDEMVVCVANFLICFFIILGLVNIWSTVVLPDPKLPNVCKLKKNLSKLHCVLNLLTILQDLVRMTKDHK